MKNLVLTKTGTIHKVYTKVNHFANLSASPPLKRSMGCTYVIG
jgi:hypothetical protein